MSGINAAASKAVKVGSDPRLHETLRELSKTKGDMKGHVENALSLYLGYVNGLLVVRKPVHSDECDAELVNLENLEPQDLVGYEFRPVFKEFSPQAVRMFIELARAMVAGDEKATIYKTPTLQYHTFDDPSKIVQETWEEELDVEKLLANVMKGHQVTFGIEDYSGRGSPLGSSFTICLTEVDCF